MYRPYLTVTLCCLFSICAIAEEEMSLEAQLEEANRIIAEEQQKQLELTEQLETLEAEIEQLRIRAKELEEEIGE